MRFRYVLLGGCFPIFFTLGGSILVSCSQEKPSYCKQISETLAPSVFEHHAHSPTNEQATGRLTLTPNDGCSIAYEHELFLDSAPTEQVGYIKGEMYFTAQSKVRSVQGPIYTYKSQWHEVDITTISARQKIGDRWRVVDIPARSRRTALTYQGSFEKGVVDLEQFALFIWGEYLRQIASPPDE